MGKLRNLQIDDSPSTGTEITEANSLLGGQVDHDETIHSGGLAVLEHALFAIAQDGVIVTHQHDGGLQAAASGGADKLQDGGDGDTVLESLGVGCLNSRSIGDRVGEGDSKLNDIYMPEWFVSCPTPPLPVRANIPAPPFSNPSRMSTASSTVG